MDWCGRVDSWEMDWLGETLIGRLEIGRLRDGEFGRWVKHVYTFVCTKCLWVHAPVL